MIRTELWRALHLTRPGRVTLTVSQLTRGQAAGLRILPSTLSGSQAYCQSSVPPHSSNIWSSATYSFMLDLVRNLIFFTAAGGNQPFITLKAAGRKIYLRFY